MFRCKICFDELKELLIFFFFFFFKVYVMMFASKSIGCIHK